MTPTTWQSLDDPVRQHQKLQRQVVDIQSFVIELHHAPSVTRLAGCLSHRSTAWAPTWKLIAPARAAARGARVPGTRHKPRPTSPHTADGNLRTVGHGHGHGHVYGETSNLGTRPSPARADCRRAKPGGPAGKESRFRRGRSAFRARQGSWPRFRGPKVGADRYTRPGRLRARAGLPRRVGGVART